MLTRRVFAGGVLALGMLAGGCPAQAQRHGPINTLGGDGAAIRGYDVVAYFVDGGPRLGRADLTAQHAGATWRFASAANRARFVADPEAYVPAYGGFCAFGVARNYLVKIEPEAWSIRDGTLYLNYDLAVRESWLREPDAFISRADANWPGLAAGPLPQ